MNESTELKKMRVGYGDALIDLAKNDEKIVYVVADSGGHERKWFIRANVLVANICNVDAFRIRFINELYILTKTLFMLGIHLYNITLQGLTIVNETRMCRQQF